MSEHQSYLVTGNGITAINAVEILRAEDATAEITVIADDPFPAYYRPALKDFLGGKIRAEKLWARPANFYRDRRIRFVHDAVVGIQAGSHSVQLRSGQTTGYSRLLLAHGARATTLTCPGSQLTGVATLRTVADYQAVLSQLPTVHRVVVVGSGTLALESIEALRHRGFQVTHLLRRRTLWSEVLDAVASDLVLQQEQRDGVDIRYEQEIAEIVGKNGRVSAVITNTGAHIPCEMVLLGIGIEPVIDFVKQSGIACGRGVKVDDSMRTNAQDVYAAGDLVETTDPLTGRTRVIGQWYPAIQQARAAAYGMIDRLDTRHVFRFGNFYNACFLYGLEFASVGLSQIPKSGKGYSEIVADPQPRTYQKTILKDGVPVGMLALGDRRQVLTFKRAVDHMVNLSPVASRLFSPDFSLEKWLDTQGVPQAIMGVSREGEVAVNTVATTQSVQFSVPPLKGLTEAMLVPLEPPELKAEQHEYYLSQTKTATIGRQEDATLPLRYPSVSRRHAEISFVNGYYMLRDLGSRNGTSINGTQLEAGGIRILQVNDQVSFGKVLWKFQLRTVNPESSFLLKRQKEVSKTSVCLKCGNEVHNNGQFCPHCGTAISQVQPGSSTANAR